MSRKFKIIFTILYAACFLEIFAFGVRPSNTKGLLLLPFGFLFFCICIWSLITAFTKWKTARFWAAAPLIACLLMLPVERIVGGFVRDELFKWRFFPHYQALVQKIESGAIPIPTEGQIPATNYDSSLAYGVWAQRDTNDVLIVEFFYGGAGPPPYHQEYVYVSSGIIEPGSYLDKRLPYKAKLLDKKFNGKWFDASD